MQTRTISLQRGRSIWWLMLVVAVIAAATLVFGIEPRLEARDALKQSTQALSVPTVAIVKPKSADPAQELLLPGTLQALRDTPIYARTNGYLRRWHADIGAHVRAGELLAEIETPEVDQQLQQARAELASAEANYAIAQTTAARWQELLASHVVTRQAADERQAQLEARKAALDAARFELGRLQKLQAFQQVRAPFAGVITARNVEVGGLINGGAGDAELFHIAAIERMRVHVSVPQDYYREAVPGLAVELTLTEFPGRRFSGRLARTAGAIDPKSHTLLAEVEVDNPRAELLPGAYAQVHLRLKSTHPALILPVNTLLFRPEGTMVAVVGANQQIELRSITLGRDFGTEIEVLDGLAAGDAVVLNPSDSLAAGTNVRIVAEPEPHKAG